MFVTGDMNKWWYINATRVISQMYVWHITKHDYKEFHMALTCHMAKTFLSQWLKYEFHQIYSCKIHKV